MNIRLGLSNSIIVALVVVSFARGAENPPRGQVGLQCSCSKGDYVIGEPVWATLSVSNGTDSIVEFAIGYSQDDSFTFAVSNSIEGSYEMLSPYSPFGGLMETQVLRPSEVLSREILLTEYIVFKKPDRYVIRCRVTFPIRSNGGAVAASESLATEIVLRSDENRLENVLREISTAATRSPNSLIRGRAVRSLASVPSPFVLGVLRQALDDKNGEVVEGALVGISRTGGSERIKLLSEYASKHEGTELSTFATRLVDKAQKRGVPGCAEKTPIRVVPECR